MELFDKDMRTNLMEFEYGDLSHWAPLVAERLKTNGSIIFRAGFRSSGMAITVAILDICKNRIEGNYLQLGTGTDWLVSVERFGTYPYRMSGEKKYGSYIYEKRNIGGTDMQDQFADVLFAIEKIFTSL